MTPFADIWARAVARVGEAALEARLPAALSPEALRALEDDRVLSTLGRCLMASGFRRQVVEAKWPAHEAAFEGFDPLAVAAWSPQRVAALAEDPRVIRHRAKLQAIVDNARFVLAVAEAHGSFGAWLAAWPDTDTVGLWDRLKRDGARLGGNTGPRALRALGKATFILTPDVLAALRAFGVIEGRGTGKADRARVQAAFNQWSAESGRDHGALSVTLAHTVGPQDR